MHLSLFSRAMLSINSDFFFFSFPYKFVVNHAFCALLLFLVITTMLRLKTSQFKLPVRTLTRPTSAARFLRPTGNVTIKTLSTAATVVATQQQKTRYFTNLWKTSAVLATSAITYGLLNNNVLALEANDCNVFPEL